jgi:SagB-type dehydrogenase family enzyme
MNLPFIGEERLRIAIVALLISLIAMSETSNAQKLEPVKLNPPRLDRGLTVMRALEARSSAQEFDGRKLDLQDLSDLLWAANGVNRPQSGKRTAPSAMNAQDIDLYLLREDGAYLYNAAEHKLEPVAVGDLRALAAGRQDKFARAPAICLLVSDISRFSHGDDSLKMIWAAEDAGIVSQNIALFCAGAGLATRPRASMDVKRLKEALKLSPTQHPMLNCPVSLLVK